MKVYKYVKSSEQLQELCNAFLTSITERMNNVIKVEYDNESFIDIFNVDYIIVDNSDNDEPNDCVGFYTSYNKYGHSDYYWNDSNSCFWVNGRVMKIVFNDYAYAVKHNSPKECVEIMLNLKSELEKLFKHQN